MLSREQTVDIVEKLDALNLIRKNRITGNWYQIYCPFHNDGNEHKPSCGVLLQDEYKNGQHYSAGFFHCFSCSASYSLERGISEILKSKSINSTGLEWLAQNVPGFNKEDVEIDPLISNDLYSQVLTKFAVENFRARMQLSKTTYVSEEELASYRFTVPYMYERKLTDAVIEKYDVGFDAKHIPPGRKTAMPCVTFPVRDITGKTLFCVRRSIQGKYFNYPEGVTKPVYGLYELDPQAKAVVICESVFNALTAVVYGHSAVALLGTGNDYQVKQLQRLGVREYVICLDNDPAGRKGTAKLKKALSKFGLVTVMTVPEGKDVNDLTKEEFEFCYQNRE